MELRTCILISFLIIIAALISSCIDKVDAEYNYQDNIIFIDAYALTEAGTSTVTISRSNWSDLYKFYTVKFIPNAKVQLKNIDTELTIDFIADSTGVYVCPSDFAVEEGEVWKLFIELDDGRKFESKPEKVKAAIPIDEIRYEYSTEMFYYAARDKFVPGHRINIDWQDPEGDKNYYLWKYKTFEPLYVCKTCEKGILRNDACEAINFGPQYYNYLCDPVCWQIKYAKEPIIFEDRLSDGAAIKNKEIVILPFYRRPDILIEVQQLSLNESAYNYFKIISDQVSASGGLNAPPAAPLFGNLFNPDDPTEIVLGQFTAAGVSSKFVFIDRSTILENPFRPDDPIILETCIGCPQSYPCKESLTKTSIEPEGWQ